MIFGGSENTIGYAVDYLTIYTIGTIFVQMVLGLNMFITCQGFAGYGHGNNCNRRCFEHNT